MTVKTDRHDARGFAQIARTGWFKPVHVKSAGSQELRTLLGARRHLVRKIADGEQLIRGLLRPLGLKVGPATRRRFAERIRELVTDKPALKAIIVSAPSALREHLVRLRGKMSPLGHLAALRPGALTSTAASAKIGLRAIARRWLALDAEDRDHDASLGQLTQSVALPGARASRKSSAASSALSLARSAGISAGQ